MSHHLCIEDLAAKPALSRFVNALCMFCPHLPAFLASFVYVHSPPCKYIIVKSRAASATHLSALSRPLQKPSMPDKYQNAKPYADRLLRTLRT
ncbi:hypothetical protein DRO64_06825 [Candidatus Bathyarchaeota archaeon]|nr:MAG: hypothetical protein DRO64_06825 [Candidatus Bathyarchaeota archaeon]